MTESSGQQDTTRAAIREQCVEAGRDLPGRPPSWRALFDRWDPIIRADERAKALNDPGYERRDRRIEAEVRERIAAEVRAHLAVAGIHVKVRADIADQIARGDT